MNKYKDILLSTYLQRDFNKTQCKILKRDDIINEIIKWFGLINLKNKIYILHLS
jgi:hypothetical protein